MKFNSFKKLIATILIMSMSSLSIVSFAHTTSAQQIPTSLKNPIPTTPTDGVSAVGNEIGKIIYYSVQDDKERRARFTQQTIIILNQKYPNYNAVISHNGGKITGEHVHQHTELQLNVGTCGYEIFLAPKGKPFIFVLNGDGGFINWAYGGNFYRDGNTLSTFHYN